MVQQNEAGIHFFQRATPKALLDESGAVFCSGREAFSGPAIAYVLGYNPGGDPETMREHTLRCHTRTVLNITPDKWSEFVDQSWAGKPKGKSKLQLCMQHHLSKLGLDPQLVPTSNLIFTRSRASADIGVATFQLIKDCWPVHEAVIDHLKPKAIICFGVETGRIVKQIFAATEEKATFREKNKRGWISRAWQAPNGLFIFGLTHPSRANWLNPAADPTPMVKELLREVLS